ncbi:MAG TPA: cytochrome C oxidase subunit IV family protein [Fimbriimonadaceae bacterium]|nr:cytochrome C oxidase subunit IV family protein [Fimbriimonadaceae bacterium]
MANTNHHDAHSHHVIPIGTYAKTFFILMVLMGLTILAAEVNAAHFLGFLGVTDYLGSYINNAIALTIAVIKATLVVMYFMGVKYGSKLIKVYALAGFVWFFLLLLIFGDYVTRSWEPVDGWYKGDTAVPQRASQIRVSPTGEVGHKGTAAPGH